MEIRETYKCIREPSALSWDSVGVVPNGTDKTADYRLIRFAGILLHVVQGSIQGLEAMEIKPGHKCFVSDWKFEDRPCLGGK